MKRWGDRSKYGSELAQRIFEQLAVSRGVRMKKIGSVSFVAMMAGLLLLGASAMADAANSAGEPEKIQIYDTQGELMSLSVEEVAKEAHGDLCLCAAVAARVTQVAILELFGEEIPIQGMLKVSYHHPGQGQRECFEYILTSECVDYVPSGDPKNLSLEDHFGYTFVRRDTGAVFETRVKEGVIPEDFFDLRYKVEGFSKGWHEDQPTEEEKAAFMQKKSEARKNLLTMEARQIFEGLDGNVAEGAVSTASA
jgi:hypothetical protein